MCQMPGVEHILAPNVSDEIEHGRPVIVRVVWRINGVS